MVRKKVPQDVRSRILHEAGYKCANPVCRTILTLDIHHLDYVADGGSNEPDNLLALCPNCHSLHHKGQIPVESLRVWKQLLASLNEAFDRRSIDLLLALDHPKPLFVSGEGVLECAALIASGFVKRRTYKNLRGIGTLMPTYSVELSERGKSFVKAWKEGRQVDAVGKTN